MGSSIIGTFDFALERLQRNSRCLVLHFLAGDEKELAGFTKRIWFHSATTEFHDGLGLGTL